MKQHSGDPAFWRQFVADYLERLAALQREVGWSRPIEAGDLVAGRFDTMEQIVGELGLNWRMDMVRGFIAPECWNTRQQPIA